MGFHARGWPRLFQPIEIDGSFRIAVQPAPSVLDGLAQLLDDSAQLPADTITFDTDVAVTRRADDSDKHDDKARRTRPP